MVWLHKQTLCEHSSVGSATSLVLHTAPGPETPDPGLSHSWSGKHPGAGVRESVRSQLTRAARHHVAALIDLSILMQIAHFLD